MTEASPLQGRSGLPTSTSTSSYWHSQPSAALLGHRTTPDLPLSASVVVVGSGITGAFAARELVHGGRDVLMLEAREACWGATGRNGGHCQPLIYASPPHVARFELATYRFLRDLVTTNNVPCDWETVGGVHSISDAETLSLVKKHLARLARDHPDLASEVRVVEDRDELAKLRVPDAHAVVFQRNAAKLWPYKLVCWVLERLLQGTDTGGKFNLQTKTPVTALRRSDTGGNEWLLSTPRGTVSTPTVVIATNAYTSHLLPHLTNLLIPVRGQIVALVAPEDSHPLEHSHVWVGPGGDDYLVQRPRTNQLILGGERLSVSDGQVGESADDVVDPIIGGRLRGALHAALKLRGPGREEEKELEADYEWTGIMGYSRDNHPWVGRVPKELGGEEGGLYLSAGYTGHGMPVTARCGVAVAEEILGRTRGGVSVPPEWGIDAGRADRARDTVLPRTLVEEIRALIDE